MSEQAHDFDLGAAVGRIEAKVDILLASKTDHDKRLKSLERTRQYVLGAIATVATLFSLKVTT